jgi:hypothetical protein
MEYILVFIIIIILAYFYDDNKSRNKKRLFDYNLEVQRFAKIYPDFIIVYPSGNMSNDFDGYIQYFNSDGKKVCRLTHSRNLVDPIFKDERLIDYLAAIKYCDTKHFKYKIGLNVSEYSFRIDNLLEF